MIQLLRHLLQFKQVIMLILHKLAQLQLILQD